MALMINFFHDPTGGCFPLASIAAQIFLVVWTFEVRLHVLYRLPQ